MGAGRALGDTYQGRGTYQLFNINERFNEVESTGLYQNRVLIRADCEEGKRRCVCVCVCKCEMWGWITITIRATATAAL